MSGFVAGGITTPSAHINTDPFWPSIDLDAMRAALRIDSSVTQARLETAVIAAALNVNDELATWRAMQQAAGITTLAAAPGPQILGKNKFEHLYARAIQAATAAEVCERYRSYDTTGTGDKKAEDLQTNIDDYRRDLRWAIRDFLGKRRTTVALI